MPRDIMANHPGYASIKSGLTENPFPAVKKEKRVKRKKGEVDRGPENVQLEPDEKGNYRVYEFGNYALVNQGEKADGAEPDFRPKNYHWRMKMPCDANWERKDPEKEDEAKERKAANRSCLIPLSVLKLTAPPVYPTTNVYRLPQGGTIAFKIKFRNEVGWGILSVEFPTDGSLLMPIPGHTPTAGPARVHNFMLGTQMGISVAEMTGTAAGTSPILSYHVEVDQDGGGTGPWTEVAGLTTYNTQT